MKRFKLLLAIFLISVSFTTCFADSDTDIAHDQYGRMSSTYDKITELFPEVEIMAKPSFQEFQDFDSYVLPCDSEVYTEYEKEVGGDFYRLKVFNNGGFILETISNRGFLYPSFSFGETSTSGSLMMAFDYMTTDTYYVATVTMRVYYSNISNSYYFGTSTIGTDVVVVSIAPTSLYRTFNNSRMVFEGNAYRINALGEPQTDFTLEMCAVINTNTGLPDNNSSYFLMR